MKYLRSVVGAGTGAAALVGTAAHHSMWLLALGGGVILLAVLAMGIVAAATFSKRNAPMARLRALVRDVRGRQG